MSSKKCYGYVAIKSPRTSTKTLESMNKTIKKYADSHEMQLDKLYFDILYGDGAGRHNMKRMQEDARENGASIIIVGDLSHIDSDIQKAGAHLEEMQDLGFQVISVEGMGGNIFDPENQMLPESIFNYLHTAGNTVAAANAAKHPKRGRPVQRSNN